MAFTTQDLKANLRYFKWNEKFETEKPYEIVSTYSNDLGAFPPTNVNREDWDVRERLIKDVRGTESYYQLDTHGFTYRSTDSTFSAFYDKEKVGNEYLPRVVYPFLKANVDNADEIYISSWRLRHSGRTDRQEPRDYNDVTNPWRPAVQVHVDQSSTSVSWMVHDHLKDRADELLKGRVRLINFWKPIHHPVMDAPLAVCDGSTIEQNDIVLVDRLRRNIIREAVWILPSDTHKWYYLSNQQPEEVLLIKMYDSDPESKASCCPHTSLVVNHNKQEVLPRESFEATALIFSNT